MVLPSERTLRDYTHYFRSELGFSANLNKHIYEQSGIQSLPDSKKYVCLVIDEMKEDLVYDKKSGKIVGFTSVGELNDAFTQMEMCSEQETAHHPPVSDHILVLMVRGIFFKMNFPYAHFATKAFTADMLFPLMWQAVQQLELMGFKVICITGDGASPNRKFFRMNATGCETTYKTYNPYSEPRENRPIYLFPMCPTL